MNSAVSRNWHLGPWSPNSWNCPVAVTPRVFCGGEHGARKPPPRRSRSALVCRSGAPPAKTPECGWREPGPARGDQLRICRAGAPLTAERGRARREAASVTRFDMRIGGAARKPWISRRRARVPRS
ncbi:MAG TPA: hypothetical protein VG096_06085 [Bryobacteraceae bacterium]|nr:hypothetical protein [Bryobacteraceae bacterium]